MARGLAQFLLVGSKLLVNTIRTFSLMVVTVSVLVSLQAQDLDPKDVRVALDRALPIAVAKAKHDFPDFENYILHSLGPRAFKGDSNGLCWEFMWQEKAFPHFKQLHVRGVHAQRARPIHPRNQRKLPTRA